MLMRADASMAGPAVGAGVGYIRAVGTPAGTTAITHARAASPLRFFTPRAGRRSAWIVSTTLGGGLVGGDQINMSVEVEAGARMLFTTQASTKVYGSSRPSGQRLHASVASGALLAVLPDPIAPFNGSTYEQHVECDLDERASVVIVDGLVSGRPAYGEHWVFDHYSSRVEIRRAGRVRFRDHLRLDQGDGAVRARMRGFESYAMAIATGPLVASLADGILAGADARAREPGGEPLVSACRLHDGSGVVVRLAGRTADAVTAALRTFCEPISALLGDDPWSARW